MLTLLPLVLAQGPLVGLASTTSSTRLPQDPSVLDEAWIRRQEGPPGAATWLSRHAEMALAGDLDGDGLFDAPAGIDALCLWTPAGAATTPYDLRFSLVSDLGPFADGDLLAWLPGQGVGVEIAEADFVALLQPTSGSFDLDGVARRTGPADEVWFSLNSDLQGTVLGDLADGDVLVWDRTAGTVSRAFTEADIQALVDSATGGGTGPIGDTIALSFLPGTGELAFVVQSPSSLDASVFVADPTGLAAPRLLLGWEESDWDFQQQTEIDALAFVADGPPPAPVLALDVPFYAPGEIARFKLRHGVPGSTAHGLRARRVGFDPRPGEGIGFLFLDPNDPLLISQLAHHNTWPQIVDSSGSATYDWTVPPLPPGLTEVDLFFQALDLAGGFSAPIVIRVR
ncbi:MAG: hypothetical protein D6702_11980 [Planctomycetota bacterium]|nr:MAG: hypothetical protein D6702_11980 [Planctomycetota bacterium]